MWIHLSHITVWIIPCFIAFEKQFLAFSRKILPDLAIMSAFVDKTAGKAVYCEQNV